jgi:hypothetical protein
VFVINLMAGPAAINRTPVVTELEVSSPSVN